MSNIMNLRLLTVSTFVQSQLPLYYFPLSVSGWRGGRFRFQRLFLQGTVGSKVFPVNMLAAKRKEIYRRHSRLTLKPTFSPVRTFLWSCR